MTFHILAKQKSSTQSFSWPCWLSFVESSLDLRLLVIVSHENQYRYPLDPKVPVATRRSMAIYIFETFEEGISLVSYDRTALGDDPQRECD